MKKYKLYDIYDDADLLGEFDTPEEVAKECNSYAKETEDTCIFLLRVGNKETKKYETCEDWKYNKRTLVFK